MDCLPTTLRLIIKHAMGLLRGIKNAHLSNTYSKETQIVNKRALQICDTKVTLNYKVNINLKWSTNNASNFKYCLQVLGMFNVGSSCHATDIYSVDELVHDSNCSCYQKSQSSLSLTGRDVHSWCKCDGSPSLLVSCYNSGIRYFPAYWSKLSLEGGNQSWTLSQPQPVIE